MKTIKITHLLVLIGLVNSFLTSCDKKETILPVPILTTLAATDITENSVRTGGDISSDEGSAIMACGVCWKKETNPTISDSKTTDGGTKGKFNSAISGLSAGTIYYIRAYATNSAGTSYGNTITFKTLATATTVTDIDENVYQTANIGTQTWMTENLRTTSFRNGESITSFSDAAKWSSAVISVYCNYDNDLQNASKYGMLYNWAAVNDNRNIAPIGWHIATDADWDILVAYLGSEYSAGSKLKDSGSTSWDATNTSATNQSGFTALPGGARDDAGVFALKGKNGFWWTATDNSNNTTSAFIRKMNAEDNTVQREYKNKKYGFSVRCVKDAI